MKLIYAGFDPWVGKIPRRKERLCTPVFWPGEFMDCRVHGVLNFWDFPVQMVKNLHAMQET